MHTNPLHSHLTFMDLLAVNLLPRSLYLWPVFTLLGYEPQQQHANLYFSQV